MRHALRPRPPAGVFPQPDGAELLRRPLGSTLRVVGVDAAKDDKAAANAACHFAVDGHGGFGAALQDETHVLGERRTQTCAAADSRVQPS